MQKNGTKCGQSLSGKGSQMFSDKGGQILSEQIENKKLIESRQLLCGDKIITEDTSDNIASKVLASTDNVNSVNAKAASTLIVDRKNANMVIVDTKIASVSIVDEKCADVVVGDITIAANDVCDSVVCVNAQQKKKKVLTAQAKNKTRVLTYTAMLVALSVICNIFDVPLGIGDLKISFSYIPTMVAGVFMGPYVGLAVGLIGDVLGLLIKPQGPWIPLITLGSALMGLIPGLIFMIKKGNPYFKLALSFAAVFLICTCTINSIGIFLTYLRGKKTFWVWMFTSRLPAQPIIVAVNAVLLFSIYYPLKKYVFAGKFSVK